MAEREELDIEILPDGRVTVRTRGAKGKDCLEYLELIQKLLGPIESTEHTSEYYEQGTGIKIDIGK